MSEIIKNTSVISKNSNQILLDIFLKDSNICDWNLHFNKHLIKKRAAVMWLSFFGRSIRLLFYRLISVTFLPLFFVNPLFY